MAGTKSDLLDRRPFGSRAFREQLKSLDGAAESSSDSPRVFTREMVRAIGMAVYGSFAALGCQFQAGIDASDRPAFSIPLAPGNELSGNSKFAFPVHCSHDLDAHIRPRAGARTRCL